MADTNKARKTVKDEIFGALWGFTHPKEKKEFKKAEAAARLGPLPDNVSDALESDGWRPIFEEWATARGIGDNVNFIRDVKIYAGDPDSKMLEYIVSQYIRVGADQIVTIDNNKIVDALEAAATQAKKAPDQVPDSHLFDDAKAEVISMLIGRYMAFHKEMSSGHT
jgi:5-methylthioribose kinase